eukprot:tig00020704_g13168.t1
MRAQNAPPNVKNLIEFASKENKALLDSDMQTTETAEVDTGAFDVQLAMAPYAYDPSEGVEAGFEGNAASAAALDDAAAVASDVDGADAPI